jgi:signal transduction histidine kinase
MDEGETWITFTIRDTGPGIAPDEQAHIFERFYRGRAAADYKVPGAGIGLSISRDLLTLMAGRLTVDSRLGAGAAFTVWLKPA